MGGLPILTQTQIQAVMFPVLQELFHHRVHALNPPVGLRTTHVQAVGNDDDPQFALARDVLVSQILQNPGPMRSGMARTTWETVKQEANSSKAHSS